MLLFHHRMPTSTINTRKANHPFTTGDYFNKTDANGIRHKTEYVLIHNGHITNANYLFEKHVGLGITYQSLLEDMTFTDSEALLWDFALVMEGKKPELEARGGNAMICVKLVDGKPKCLYFGRNSNPLYITKDNEELHLSSQGLNGELLKAGSGKAETMAKMNTLYTWHFINHRLSEKPFTFPQYTRTYTQPYQSYDGGFDNDNYHSTPNHLRLSKRERRALRKQQRTWERDHTWTPGSHAASASKQAQIGFNAPLNRDASLERATKSLVKYTKPVRKPQNVSTRENSKLPTISQDDIDNRCIVYLAGSGGNFFDAYERMKDDLEILREQESTDDNITARSGLVAAMRKLNDDPEWVNKDSISSVWRALWQNRNQLKKAA